MNDHGRSRTFVGAAALALALALRVAAGCRPPPVSTVCSPRTGLPCLTGVTCAVDRRNGCEVCRCADPAFVPLGSPDGRPR